MKKTLKQIALFIVIPLTITAAVMMGCNIGQYEEASYEVINQTGPIELRIYTPSIAAEVSVTGERKEAISMGFRLIADYIFGNNESRQTIAMTAPVIQQSSEKIPMTTPVIQQEGNNGKWTIQFIMPSRYSLATLPLPGNKEVKLRELPARKLAAIRFSGSNKDDHLIKEKLAELQAYIVTNHMVAQGAPILAFYDPPWTLPFLRRNEVMLEVADVKKPAAKPRKR